MTRIGITGHQVIPDAAWPFIEKGVDDLLAEFGGRVVAVSSLAAGADQYFAAEVRARGGDLVAVIPSANYTVSFSDTETLGTFQKLREAAIKEIVLPFPDPSEEAFLAAGRRVAVEADVLLAIWDGREARGKGGTGDIVAFARTISKPVRILWPEGVRR